MKGISLAVFTAAALGLSGTAFATGSGGSGGTCDQYVQVNTQNPYNAHSGNHIWTVWQWGNRGTGVCKDVTMWCNIYEPKHKGVLEHVPHGQYAWGGFTNVQQSKKNPNVVNLNCGHGKCDLNAGQNWNFALVIDVKGHPGQWAQVDCHMRSANGKKTADWQKVMVVPC